MSNTQESPKPLFDWQEVEKGTWRYNPQYDAYKENVPKLLTFTDKASYFQWVAEWKAEYTKIATELRRLRTELSKPHVVTETKTQWGSFFASEASVRQSSQARLRYLATTLLFIRRESKQEAGRQMRERVVKK